jgi:hypothetical protein
MTKHSGGATINQGGASKPTQDERSAEYEIAGNAELKGEKTSPADRARGESSSADPAPAVDIDPAHDRAS